MTFHHLYTGSDGNSHFAEIELDFTAGFRASSVFPAQAVSFVRVPSGTSPGQMHPSRTRHIAVILAGAPVLTSSDGTTIALNVGDAILAEDTDGVGHQAGASGEYEQQMMIIRLDGDGARAAAPGGSSPRASSRGVQIAVLSSTDDGGSSFTRRSYGPGDEVGVKTVSFVRLPAGLSADWHPEPRRQFVITLAGDSDLEATNGEVMHVGPGDVMLVEDVVGKGHRTEVGRTADRLMAVADLA